MASCAPVEVFIEAGHRRVFASALDWPGWSRASRTEELALQALADYLPRYAPVVLRARLDVPAAEFTVVERSPGISKDADFGTLGAAAAGEDRPVPGPEGQRLAALLESGWAELALAAAGAPAVLPKGPRGGGRDRDAILAHVAESEAMYARKLGIRPPGGSATDWPRQVIVETLARGTGAEPGKPGGWPARYVVRRIGWHVLDHAWELRDKSGQPVPDQARAPS
jgi:hypothetical protein